MASENLDRLKNKTERILIYYLLALIALVLSTAIFVVYINSFRAAPIFLFLYFIGIGIMFILPLSRSSLVILLLIAIWVFIKQFIGRWETSFIFFNIIEIFLLGGTFYFAGIYQQKTTHLIKKYQDTKKQLSAFLLEDQSVGLLQYSFGQLRLREEQDRSLRYKRPISLIVVNMDYQENIAENKEEINLIMRNVATMIKDDTREMDIPFKIHQNKFALLLPETGIEGATIVVKKILNHLLNRNYLDSEGIMTPLDERVKIRFGYSSFLGLLPNKTELDLLKAANKSLRRNIKLNTGDLYQNLFIDWEIIGEEPEVDCSKYR